MTHPILRRELWGLGAGLGLAACTTPQPPPPPRAVTATNQWLDVHCHVFNAADLPMFEFAQRCILPEKAGFLAELPLTLALVTLMTGGLAQEAVTVEQEAAWLATGVEPAEQRRPGAFEFALRPPAGLAPQPFGGPPDPLFGLHALRERARLPGQEPLRAFRNLALRAQRPLADPGSFHGLPTGEDMVRLLDQALRDGGVRSRPGGLPTERELNSLKSFILNDSVLSSFVAWGHLLTLKRSEIIDRLMARHGGGPAMLTPALVDYDLWLGAEDNDQPGQVRLMGTIARKRAEAGQAVHAFMAFDPWRALLAIQAGRDFLAPFRTAILERGDAIGLKIYPPMGFRAAGNAGAGLEYPDGLVDLMKQPAQPGPYQAVWSSFNGDPGAGLDYVLDQAFAWCSEPDNDVPVMTHCGDTLGTSPAASNCAHPAHWRRVLLAHPTLRLNLGHFGGAWDLGDAAETASGFTWTREIVAMLAEEGGRRFPNLYVDVAFFAEVLPAVGTPKPDALDRAAHQLQLLRDASDKVLDQRLMYGSDWDMTGFLPNTEDYADQTMAVLRRVWNSVEAQENLRWRNACRFLGMTGRGKTAGRLEDKVYRGVGQPALDRLRAFRVD